MSGLRDRALMATMVYSFARIGAVLAMKVEDYYRADSPDKLEQVTEHPLSAPPADRCRQAARAQAPTATSIALTRSGDGAAQGASAGQRSTPGGRPATGARPNG